MIAATNSLTASEAPPRSSLARSFVVRLCAFLAPFALGLSLPSYVLVRAGELTPISLERVARAQRGSDELLLYGPAYTNINKSFKVTAAADARARVLVVGTSRSMQLRASLFPKEVSFYNAGGAVSRVGHLRKFLARIPEGAQPEVLLLALDQWFFDPGTERAFEQDWDTQVDAKPDVLGVLSNWNKVYSDWFGGKFSLSQINAPRTPAVGLNAVVHQNGFRNDGSYYYGAVTLHPDDPTADPDRTCALTLARVRAGSTRFEFADHVDARAIDELGKFLEAAKARKIHVVGWITSFAPIVVDAMYASGKFGYLQEILPALRPLFAARGYSVFDFTDLRGLGANASEFIDGVHASEYAHLRMMRVMVQADSKLPDMTSLEHIDRLKAASSGPLVIADTRWR